MSNFCIYSGNIGLLEDNYFDIKFVVKMGTGQLFSLAGGYLCTTIPYPQKGKFIFSKINLSGNQDSVPVAGNGGAFLGYLQFFNDMDIRIMVSDLSGSRVVDINTEGGFVNQQGNTVEMCSRQIEPSSQLQ